MKKEEMQLAALCLAIALGAGAAGPSEFVASDEFQYSFDERSNTHTPGAYFTFEFAPPRIGQLAMSSEGTVYVHKSGPVQIIVRPWKKRWGDAESIGLLFVVINSSDNYYTVVATEDDNYGCLLRWDNDDDGFESSSEFRHSDMSAWLDDTASWRWQGSDAAEKPFNSSSFELRNSQLDWREIVAIDPSMKDSISRHPGLSENFPIIASQLLAPRTPIGPRAKHSGIVLINTIHGTVDEDQYSRMGQWGFRLGCKFPVMTKTAHDLAEGMRSVAADPTEKRDALPFKYMNWLNQIGGEDDAVWPISERDDWPGDSDFLYRFYPANLVDWTLEHGSYGFGSKIMRDDVAFDLSFRLIPEVGP